MQNPQESKPAPKSEDKCLICSRTGGLRRWELCSNGHFELVCDNCVLQYDKRRPCIVKDCHAENNLRTIKQVLACRQRWFKGYSFNKSTIQKYSLIKEQMLALHEDTWDPFRVSVQRALRTNTQLSKARLFEDYIESLTTYMLGCKLAESREYFGKLLEQDDKLNSGFQEMIKAYEDINTFVMTSERKPRSMRSNSKIEKHALHCLVCFGNFNVLYTWTYCENEHPLNSVCKECLYKLRECPVCRGKLRTNAIRANEESMAEWDGILNRHLSISDMLNLISKETISKASKDTIFKKLRDQSFRIKTSDLNEYLLLIENLAAEWCYEADREKCGLLFRMIEAYEQEYELLINLKKVIKDKIAEFGESTKTDIKELKRQRKQSSDAESSWSSLAQRNNANRRIQPARDNHGRFARRQGSSSRSRSPSLSRSRSRSRSRDQWDNHAVLPESSYESSLSGDSFPRMPRRFGRNR